MELGFARSMFYQAGTEVLETENEAVLNRSYLICFTFVDARRVVSFAVA